MVDCVFNYLQDDKMLEVGSLKLKRELSISFMTTANDI